MSISSRGAGSISSEVAGFSEGWPSDMAEKAYNKKIFFRYPGMKNTIRESLLDFGLSSSFGIRKIGVAP